MAKVLACERATALMKMMNPRVGAFGWLAGTTIEQQVYPNAGLSDQRLLFDWVETYIHQVGGKNKSFSAWGDSAGASSILHHLVSRNGGAQLVPKFQRIAIQSPAFQWLWERAGFMEQTYINYTCFVCAAVSPQPCCPDTEVQPTPLYTVKELSDLADHNISALVQANQALFQNTQRCNGLFPVGPSLDGNILRHLAPVEFANKRFAALDSLIISHVYKEAESFINPPYVNNDSDYDNLLRTLFSGPHLSQGRQNIENQYALSRYNNNETLRLLNTIQDLVFLSNNRIMFNAYNDAKSKVFTLHWDGFNLTYFDKKLSDLSVHATDLSALFFNKDWSLYGFLKEHFPDAKITPPLAFLFKVALGAVSKPYQTYWTRHARTGDPNQPADGPPTLQWSQATVNGAGIGNTMFIRPDPPYFKNDSMDTMLDAGMADFWLQQAQYIDASVKQISSSAYLETLGSKDQVPISMNDL